MTYVVAQAWDPKTFHLPVWKAWCISVDTLPGRRCLPTQTVASSQFAFLCRFPFYRHTADARLNGIALVFASDAQLDLLCEAQCMYINSTFHVVLSVYYQLFTIIVQHSDGAFPLLFAITSPKTSPLYEEVHELVANFAPSQVIADFKEAPTAAIWLSITHPLSFSTPAISSWLFQFSTQLFLIFLFSTPVFSVDPPWPWPWPDDLKISVRNK